MDRRIFLTFPLQLALVSVARAAPPNLATSPLRNRIRVSLNANVEEVWSLVGDLSRFPEYSSGLSRVEPVMDPTGRPKEYTCYFKPMEASGESISHREIFKWYEANVGWATQAEEPNAFGLTRSLSMLSLEPSGTGTELTFAQFYDAADLARMRMEFDAALTDIADNLVRRFGGRLIEKFVEQ